MLSKKNRVDKKGVDLVFKKGGLINSPTFSFKFILDSSYFSPRISFIVSKKISKLAVRRNFLRRKGYLALEKHINKFPSGFLGVFVFKKAEENVLKIENEIKEILNKIN